MSGLLDSACISSPLFPQYLWLRGPTSRVPALVPGRHIDRDVQTRRIGIRNDKGAILVSGDDRNARVCAVERAVPYIPIEYLFQA